MSILNYPTVIVSIGEGFKESVTVAYGVIVASVYQILTTTINLIGTNI